MTTTQLVVLLALSLKPITLLPFRSRSLALALALLSDTNTHKQAYTYTHIRIHTHTHTHTRTDNYRTEAGQVAKGRSAGLECSLCSTRACCMTRIVVWARGRTTRVTVQRAGSMPRS